MYKIIIIQFRSLQNEVVNYCKKNKSVFLIVLLALIFRTSTLSQNMTFTADEAYLSYITKTIIEDFHIIWIGWSALGFDLYLGPYWIYIMYPFLALSNGDPLILGFLSSIMGTITTFLLYWTGNYFFSKRVGIIASILYASLPLVVYYDQKPYPPGVPLLSMIICISLLMTQKSPKWWILFFASYFATFHIHLSLIMTGLVGLYLIICNYKVFNKNIVVQSIIVVSIMIAPLLVFDYYHNASNITAPIRALRMISNSEGSNKRIYHHAKSFSEYMGRLYYLPTSSQVSDEIIPNCSLTTISTRSKSPVILSILGIVVYLLSILRKSVYKDKSLKIIVLLSLSFVIPYLAFTFINPIEYYLLGFAPLYFLIVGYLINTSKGLIRLGLSILVIILVLLGILTNLTVTNDYGIETKKQLVQSVMYEIGDENYYLMANGGCQQVGGWRYLFSVYGNTPTRSTDDKTFSWLYPEEVSDEEVVYTVDVYESRALEPKNNFDKVINIGGYSAYIHRH